jgi:glucose/arabinose dehydrogenase
MATAPALQPLDPAPRVALEPVVEGLDRPLYATGAGDGSGRLFLVEKAGTVRILREGEVLAQPFLDIRDLVASRASERGLLSIAFHPDYAENGFLFVNYTDLDGNTVIARYQVAADNPDRVEPQSASTLLTIAQPAANHNGGGSFFGPDGLFYIGTGDGGRAGDPWNNAQTCDTLLGKMLRIDVAVERGAAAGYTIPPDNPLLEHENLRPEIWAWGLRNPWRFAFDRATGDLYIADVGQNAYEEVHYLPATGGGMPPAGGQHYGWNTMEGAACYPENQPCNTRGLEQPVVVYPHRDGCSVTGGSIYRGSRFAALQGLYFYADYCSGKLWALRKGTGGTWQQGLLLETGLNVSSFGEDDAGEIYLTDIQGGGVYQLVERSQ